MSDTAIAITAGSGTNVDTRTEATNGNHRQVVVLGDPSLNAGVAPVDATKGLAVDLTNTGANATAIKVDNSAVTQPVSATSLPLPTGAATSAKQDTGNTSVASIDGKLPALGQALAAASVPVVLTAAQVTTLTPPAAITGFATAVKQPALGTAGTASADVITVQGIASMTALKTDSSATTQPVSAASLPLPALAATSTKQSDGTQKTQVVDGSGNVIGATSNALDVNIKSGASSGAVAQGSTTSGQTGSLVQGAVTTAAPSYTTAQTSPLSLTTAGALRTDASATTQPVSASSLPLPTGAATSAAQGTGNTSVASIDTKTPALGQALAAASVPVVLTAAQITTLTPPAAITGFALDATLTGGTQKTKLVDSGGTNAASISAGGAVKVDNSAVTQPVSGTFWQATQPVSLTSTTVTGTVAVSESGTWTVQPGNTPNSTPWLTTQIPATSGGLSTYHLVSAATTNATVVKAGAGQLFGYFIYNSNAAARKLIFHNASTTPTAGASVFFSIVIPPTSGANVNFDAGIAFSTGISITTTTGLADNDTAGVALNDLVINLFYK